MKELNQAGFGGTREQQAFEVIGVHLDYLASIVNFTQENYRLDLIGHVELGNVNLIILNLVLFII